jgi:hypothetical protein
MNLTGYDIVAMAKKDGLHTEVLVVNNNHNSFLVVSRIDDTSVDAMTIEKFNYGPGIQTVKRARTMALHAMVRIALAYTDDSDDDA